MNEFETECTRRQISTPSGQDLWALHELAPQLGLLEGSHSSARNSLVGEEQKLLTHFGAISDKCAGKIQLLYFLLPLFLGGPTDCQQATIFLGLGAAAMIFCMRAYSAVLPLVTFYTE